MKYEFTSNLVMIAQLKIKQELREEFLDYIITNLDKSRSWPGNIRFDILIDETCPDLVLFHEIWESAEAQQTYMAWRVKAGDLAILLSFLTEMPKFTALRCMAA